MEERFDALATQIAALEQAMLSGFAEMRDYMDFCFSNERARTDAQFAKVDAKFDTRFDRLETKFDRLETRVEAIESGKRR